MDADTIIRVAHGRRTSDTLREVAPELTLRRKLPNWIASKQLSVAVSSRCPAP